jgi:hypothetical protein
MLGRARTAVFIVGFLALFGFLAFQAGIATKKNPQQQQAQTASAEQHESKNPFKRLWEWTTHDPVAFYTSVLAIFTGILGASTVALWWSTRRLVRCAEETAQRQLRAYVFAIQGRVRDFAAGEPVKIVINAKNTGQTPAYEFHHSMSLAMAPDPPTEPFPELQWEKVYKSAIGPGQTLSNFAEFPNYKLSEGHMARLKARKAAIWAYGELRYNDAFGKPHVSKFKFGFHGDVVTDPARRHV